MELLLLPFFWLAPVMALGLGYAMSGDSSHLKTEYDVELPDIRYLFYLLPFTLSHLGGLVWRVQRRNWIAGRRGFEQSAFSRAKQAHERGRIRRLVLGVVLGQLLGLVLLAFVPDGASYARLVDAGAVVFLASWAASPFVIGYDALRITRTPHVDWGRSRFAYVPATLVPLVPLVYLVKRDDHVWCATLVEHWRANPAEFNIDEEGKSSIERFADWSNDVF